MNTPDCQQSKTPIGLNPSLESTVPISGTVSSSSPSTHNLRMDLVKVEPFPANWIRDTEVGRGSFGKIVLVLTDIIQPAHHRRNVFALKMMKTKPQNLHVVLREIEMHRMCREHDNILLAGVSYFQQIGEDYRVSTCLEYAALGDLWSFASRPNKIGQVAYICEEINQGLIHIHSLGLVHSDICLKNILMTHNGMVKISDFGAADALEKTLCKKVVVGTPGFIAPEIFAKNGFDSAADMWSLGLVAVHLLSGEIPFKTGNEINIQTYQTLISQQYYPDVTCFKNTLFEEFISLLNSYNPTQRIAAIHLENHDFFSLPCTQRELIEDVVQSRLLGSQDLPYPTDMDMVVPME